MTLRCTRWWWRARSWRAVSMRCGRGWWRRGTPGWCGRRTGRGRRRPGWLGMWGVRRSGPGRRCGGLAGCGRCRSPRPRMRPVSCRRIRWTCWCGPTRTGSGCCSPATSGAWSAAAKSQGFVGFHRCIRYWIDAALDEITPEGTGPVLADQYARRAWTLDGTLDAQARFAGATAAIIGTEPERQEQRGVPGRLGRSPGALRRRGRRGSVVAHRGGSPGGRVRAAGAPLPRPWSPRPGPPGRSSRCWCGWETLHGRICELANGVVLNPAQAADALTTVGSADLERAVFDPESRVIDLGRRSRVFTGGARRAIEIQRPHLRLPWLRGRGPWRRGRAHRRGGASGGGTPLADGRLLCPAHNRQRPGRRPTPDPRRPGPTRRWPRPG
jgi:hypothetical protein